MIRNLAVALIAAASLAACDEDGSSPANAATFVVQVEDEQFRVRIEDAATIAQARALLRGEPGGELARFVLGPSLGQCCGGVMNLRFERVGPADVESLKKRLGTNLQPVALFGGGHVGNALIQVLSGLPFDLTWIDSRDGIFPPALPGHVTCEQSDPVPQT